MRIWPSQSTVMNRKVGSITFVHDREIQTIALGNRSPIVDSGATKRIHAHADVRAANRIHVEDPAEIAYVSVKKVVPVGGCGSAGPIQ